jgi:Mrp family chromosome partitioning ATPase/cytoskeletal protein RodZ
MNETTDATAIFAPLWRRKWLILTVAIVVAAVTYAYYKRQPAVYSATTQLYLASGSEEQGLLNGSQTRAALNDRDVTDQATLINSSALGEPIHRRLRETHELAAARGKAHASGAAGSDFITITAEARTAKGAVTLANAYAQTYIKRQRADYQRDVKAAIAATRRQLRRIEAGQSRTPSKGKGSSSSAGSVATVQAASLASKINQLEADLSVAGVQDIGSGKTRATLLSPTPKKNAIFGFVLGLLLAAVAAYAVSRFDRRLRTLKEIEAVFGAQVLAALPTVREPIVQRDGRLAPADTLVEPLRRLHTTLLLGDMLEHDRERAPRTILFVSADAGDGASTAIANLALVQRDSGERVAVLEANLRHPVQAGLLEVGGQYGLAEVLVGTLSASEALQRVEALPARQAGVAPQEMDGSVSTMVESRVSGSVSVLASGGTAANPPALLSSRAMTDLLRSLAEDFEHVLIDAPPPLAVSDAMPLLGAVDGIVLLARAGHTREVSARRLVQLLARVSSAPVLGVLVNSVSRADLEQYGFSAGRRTRRRARKPTLR